MAENTQQIARTLADHFVAHQETVTAALGVIAEPAVASCEEFVARLLAGGKVIALGNGGSATQASHLVGELIGRYKNDRRPFPAVSLPADAGAVTCIANDFGYDALFARQIEALARPGDLVIGLTTSGRSANVLQAFAAARAAGTSTIALTGAAGLVGGEADFVIAVPSSVTAHVQEVHGMIIHFWCSALDHAVSQGLAAPG